MVCSYQKERKSKGLVEEGKWKIKENLKENPKNNWDYNYKDIEARIQRDEWVNKRRRNYWEKNTRNWMDERKRENKREN